VQLSGFQQGLQMLVYPSSKSSTGRLMTIFDAAWAEGTGLSLDAAVAEALKEQ
jgi:hypothetical protein